MLELDSQYLQIEDGFFDIFRLNFEEPPSQALRRKAWRLQTRTLPPQAVMRLRRHSGTLPEMQQIAPHRIACTAFWFATGLAWSMIGLDMRQLGCATPSPRDPAGG
jgi:hypothetical protein